MFNEITEKDVEKINEEIDYRINVLRPQISQEIIDAKAHGDLSENDEYHSARRRKGQNEGRIEYLRHMLKTAKIVSHDNNHGEVGLFDKVSVLFVDEGTEEVIRLSTTLRNDASQGIISRESPFGRAVFGKKIGDRVTVNVNDTYSYDVVIKDIEKADDSDIDLPIV